MDNQSKRLGMFASAIVVTLACGLTDAAQKTATFTGASGVDANSYNDPANWDIGEVPINNATDTFIVNIPGGVTVNYDVPQLGGATNQVDALSISSSSTLNYNPGRALNATAASIDGATIDLTTGSTTILPTSLYDVTRAGDLLTADGTGTVLDLSATTTMTRTNMGGNPTTTLSASGGALIDLSGLTTITNNSGDDVLRFTSTSGGTYDFSALTTITGPVEFDIDAAAFALTALQSTTGGFSLTRTAGSTTTFDNLLSSSGGVWRVPTGGSINAASLTQLRNTTVDFSGGSTLNTPSLVDIQGSFIQLDPTATFNHGALFNIDDAKFELFGGASLTVSAGSYRSDGTGTIISLDGPGTTLDMSSVTTWTQNNLGGTPNRTVTVKNNATLDLSNLTSITNSLGDDQLIFEIQSNGTIDFTNLQSVDGPVQFDIEVPSFTLPALNRFDNGTWTVDENSTIHAPTLTELRNTTVNIADGGELNAPVLNDISGSTINLGPNQTFTHGNLGAIDSTRFFLTGGANLAVTATSYAANRTGTIISVDGIGTLLDLSTVATWTQANLGGDPDRTVVAQSGGKIDLSGLQTITVDASNEILTFRATSSGLIDLSSLQTANGPVVFDVDAESTIKLGDFTVTPNVTINVNDVTSTLMVNGSLLLDPSAVINVATGGGFSVGGNYAFETMIEANADLSEGALTMNGSGTAANPQFLEVGGENLGLPAPVTDPTAIPGTDGNFAIGQLTVGQVGQDTVVELRDVIDNGNRNSLEALYLAGLGGDDGLKLFGNSTLIINSIDVYVFLNNDGKLGDTVAGGEWVHLNALLAGLGVNQLSLSQLTNDSAANGIVLIPEPASLALLGLGGLAMARRRRR